MEQTERNCQTSEAVVICDTLLSSNAYYKNVCLCFLKENKVYNFQNQDEFPNFELSFF